MAGPGDQLFSMLAQSKGLPSHALRATEAAEAIPGEGLEGLQSGMQARQNIQQYQLLNTKLGDIFGDPSNIPYGLPPDRTMKDLLTIAPTMQNYIPAGFATTVAGAYGANTGGGPASSSPTSTPPSPPQTPATPSPTPGASSLASAGGAGGGQGGAFAPGSPTSIPASASAGPSVTIPPGGISKTAFQLLEPALAASQKERDFQQGQLNENQRSGNSINAENIRAGNSLNAENTRFGEGQFAQQMDEYNKANVKQMSGFNALKQLSQNLNAVPVAETGPIVGKFTRNAASGSSGVAPELSSFNQIREGLIGNFAAALDPNGRQNQALLQQLEIMTPTVQDSPQARNNKLAAMHGMLTDSINQNYTGYNTAAMASGHRLPPPQIPSFQQLMGGSNSNAQAAIDWANANPNDPRARAVLAKAQANGI